MAENDSSQLQIAIPPTPLPVEQLYRKSDPADLDFTTTEQVEPLADHFGQDRAIEALQFGMRMPHEGYNIYVLGSTGVGKRELLQSVFESDPAAARGEVYDWCYVNNFEEPDKPKALRLPRGMAVQLRKDMAAVVEDLLVTLPAAFQSDEYGTRVQELAEEFQSQEQDAFQALADEATANNVAMIQTPNGYTLAPLKDGDVMKPDEFEALPEETREKTTAVIEELKDKLKALVRQVPGWKKESRQKFRELNRVFCRQTIDPVFAELKDRYEDHPAVVAYLDAVHADVMEQAAAFTTVEDESPTTDNIKRKLTEFPQYSVNVLVDNAALDNAPIVYEDHPTFANLIGRVEYVSQMGTLTTDFTLIKPGALHRANGGYLVIEADKVLTNLYAWQALKRALRARELRIQSLDQIFSFVNTVQLQPEALPLDVKVVLTGDRHLYYILEQYDPEFPQLFKVPADMSEDVSRNPDSTTLFARMIRTLQQRDKLLPLDRAAVARVIEYAARRVEDSEKLSLHRGHMGKLLVESDFCARQAGADLISAEHVHEAVAASVRRLDQFREKSHEHILRDILLVETTGLAVGRVNALSVYMLGDYSFGKPTRITATARLGTGGVLDIEREVDLGGKIHSKAVMIISSLLASRYAREQSLPLSASLVFEQSYGGVEGDSASVAEFVALISAITGIPVLQHLAVTGSLNQHGQVQAVGGVNEKIEGFFDICRHRGLDGKHAVAIPRANAVNLMLREDVVNAVADGQFSVFVMDTVNDALELLLGVAAASVDQSVSDRIEAWQKLRRKFADRRRADKDEE